MNKKLQLASLFLLIFSVITPSHAQTNDDPLCIEVNAGYREYLGDLGSSLFFQNEPIYQGVGVNVGYYVNPLIDAVFNFTAGDVGYRATVEPLPEPYKFKGFTANTMDATIGARIKLPALYDAKLAPYIHAAFGGYYTHSRPLQNPVSITDMGANLQGGLGLTWRVTPTWGVRWSFTANYTMNDRWDGSNGQNPGAALIHGLYRTNDLYSHHAVGVTYSFGQGNGPKRLRDKDGDGVPDKYDICKETPEKYWDFVDSVGCPVDTDKDGVLDGDDKCRLVAGLAIYDGCPDTDGDSIQDSQDDCPNQAGLAQFNGCPDRDNDNVADKNDVCPDVPGLPVFKGCPDTDEDGIPDNKDKCPSKAGSAEGEGCPDTDSDGVFDHLDRCPEKPGLAELKGCPEIKKEVQDKIALAAKGINFETGKDVIISSSFGNLDKLAETLNEYPEAKVDVQGHTDDRGDHDKNVSLSENRAASVQAYLTSHGIAAERMTSHGFGPDKPIASNKSASGRAKNRRVDFVLTY